MDLTPISTTLAITFYISMGVIWTAPAIAQSTIVLDGSTGAGSGAGQDFSGLSGSQTIILEGGGVNRHGTVNGSNLFFSFDKFNIAAGDTAQFQCTGCASLDNVLSRVTGNTASIINGTLKSLIPNATFWFFNPNGLILGANSVINVPAALHMSSGNSINFGAVSFDTLGNPNSSSLSFANPTAFGFSSGGNISVSGTTITVGNGGVELAAAQDFNISAGNTINSQNPVNISAGNASGVNASINMADNSVLNSGSGAISQHSFGRVDIGINAVLDGSVSADTDLTNSGTVTGNAQAGADMTNTNTGVLENGATAANNILNNGVINGGSVQAGGDILNAGAIHLNQAGAVNVIAGRDLVNQGNGGTTGVIVINHGSGTETVTAGRDLNLGQGVSVGVIQKLAGNGNLTIRSGSGNLLINNNGSGISDSSSGAGNLSVIVPTGQLQMGSGGSISKSGVSSGALTVDVQAGNLGLAQGAEINAAPNNILDVIKVSGTIDNNGNLNAHNIQTNSNLTNQAAATITGQVNASGFLNNSGTINGDVTADLGLNNTGVITGQTTSAQASVNAGVIHQNVISRQGLFVNNGIIDGDFEATNGSLINTQTITGMAKAAVDLENQANATIGKGAQAGRDLINHGELNGATVVAGRDLINSGSHARINLTDAGPQNLVSAGRDLLIDQGAKINVNSHADSQIIAANNLQVGQAGIGLIEKFGLGSGALIIKTTGAGGALGINNAGSAITDLSTGGGSLQVTAQAHDLTLDKGTAIEKTAAGQFTVSANNGGLNLFESARISANQSQAGDVIRAGTSIANHGLLAAQAIQAGSDFNNTGTVTGTAYANQNLNNRGIMNGNTQAGQDLYNYGLIQGASIRAGRDLLNSGSKALIHVNGTGVGEVSAGRNLLLEQAAKLTADNTGNTFILAGKDLTVKDPGSRVSLDNQGRQSMIAAGTLLNNNLAQSSATGGDLRLANAAGVEKFQGTGDLIVSANKQPGVSLLEKSSGGRIIISDPGTTLNAGHNGRVVVNAEATADIKKVDQNGRFKSNDKSQFALQITKGGAIKTEQNASLDVQSQTVYLQGHAVSSQSGDVTFTGRTASNQMASEASNLKQPPQQFRMQSALISSAGSVSINNYYLDMQTGSVPSGIKAGTEIKLQVQNLGKLDFPMVIVGKQAAEKGMQLQLPYLDTPVLNKQNTSTPDVNKVLKAANLAVLAKQTEIPSLPKNPCDRQFGQSSFQFHGTGVYVPDVSAQLPYSMLAVTAKPSLPAPNSKAPNPVAAPSMPLSSADDCRNP